MTPPLGLNLEEFAVTLMMATVGIPTVTVRTLPELLRRIIIWERLTHPIWPSHVDRTALLKRYLGLEHPHDKAFPRRIQEKSSRASMDPRSKRYRNSASES